MNLNLSSVFGMSSSEEAYASNSHSIDVVKLIKGALIVGLVILMLLTSSITEYVIVVAAIVIFHTVYHYYQDLMSIDLHFSSEDIDMNDIIDDLWN